MKILFAVSNENISEAVKREYQNNYKAQLVTKNVYYFNAIIKELQNNKTYDVVIISEDLEPFANNNYDTIDKFLSDKLQTIREEAVDAKGNNVPIIFITTDRHILGDFFTSKLYEIGIYNALVGNDRSIENVCTLMFHPRQKHEARAYYRVNSEIDNSPKEDDVKEEEIKNIIAHYKKLGKAEERYVESFDNIASQYNDAQLKVIIRFLPLNVKAVLEAQSPKYQSLTTFANNYNSGAISAVPQTPKAENIKEKNVSVETNNDRVLEQISSIKDASGVIVPKAMNINRGRKIETGEFDDETPTFMADRRKNDIKNEVKDDIASILPGFENDATPALSNEKQVSDNVLPGLDNESDSILPGFEESIDEMVSDNSENLLPGVNTETVTATTPQEEPVVKRGRGRPRKNPVAPVVEGPKRGRGRPRKVQVVEEEPQLAEEIISNEPESILPGFEDDNNNNIVEQQNSAETLPGFEEVVDTLPGFEESSEVLPRFDGDNGKAAFENQSKADTLPGFDENNSSEAFGNQSSAEALPGFEDENLETNNSDFNDLSASENNNANHMNNVEGNNYTKESFVNPLGNIQKVNPMYEKQSVRYENIEYLIPADKRIVSFVGTSKSGVSFIVNNLGQMLSSFNIDVAILDLTKNKNTFYIYTNNDEALRNKAEKSIYNLLEGVTDGIKVNKNLTLYTALPTDNEKFYEADKVLKTLMDNHSVILIDCDYDTPIGYFDNSTDVFMVQNMDILTMQPLTTFLKELKAKNVLKDEKLRLISNMETKVKGVNPQILLNAIAVYKDPGMAYTVDLFNRNSVKVFSLPFDVDAYSKYLTSLVECNMSLTGYSKSLLTGLKEIATFIYPLLSTNNKKKHGYTPPSYDKYATTSFNNNVGDTLNQMKNRY